MTPEGLLEAARALIPPGPGRPSSSRIRRSISSSYYALFTALTAEFARPYMPNVRAAARRLIDHGKARSACEKINSDDPNLRKFARLFIDLYKARQSADYDHTYRPDKIDAVKAIKQAKSGIDSLSQAQRMSPVEVQRMCVMIIATDTQRKHMARRQARI